MNVFNLAHLRIILNELCFKENNITISKAAVAISLSRKHLFNIVNCKVH